MQLDVSVKTAAGVRDVGITAPIDAPIAEVLAAVEAAVGAAVGLPAPSWSGDRPLAGSLGESGLRVGAVLDGDAPGAPEPGGGVLCLQVVGGPAAGRCMALDRGVITIGRDPSCDLVLADPDVSRRHAAIEVSGSVTLRDLGSTNRTYLDGEPGRLHAPTAAPRRGPPPR